MRLSRRLRASFAAEPILTAQPVNPRSKEIEEMTFLTWTLTSLALGA